MKAFAKANVFLKIVGLNKNGYHLLSSRFVLVREIYDELFFVRDKHCEGFEIVSEFSCEGNIINKAYQILCESGFENEMREFFKTHALKLIKNIPVGGGLGGGSSDGAAFLRLVNKELNLKISQENLMKMGANLGCDVPFFLSGFEAANVSGVGEILAEFEDEIPPLNFKFPQISCDTRAVYGEFDGVNFGENLGFCGDLSEKFCENLSGNLGENFDGKLRKNLGENLSGNLRENAAICHSERSNAKRRIQQNKINLNAHLNSLAFSKPKNDAFLANSKLAKIYENQSSAQLLQSEKNTALNDLFMPCVNLYPKMAAFLEQGYFLSGSGSSVFKAF